tara:strand:+ start:404 stop:1102 length:699 start_codon:yes stop_codon:yes gene_type:complete
MKKYLMLFVVSFLYADNEVYVDQVGATFNLDIEQLGSSNIIGGTSAISGTMTPLDLDGTTMTLDINQIGNTNKFLGDITSDNFTGFFEFDGDGNNFDIQVDPTNTYGADGGNFNVDVTGGSNTFTLDVATNDLASTLDLDWIIQGDSNTLNFDIDYDLATNYVDIDGDSNTVNFDADGYSSGYFYLDQTGSSRTFNIEQQSTLASDWLQINSTGSNGTVCVVQSDGGTTTSC